MLETYAIWQKLNSLQSIYLSLTTPSFSKVRRYVRGNKFIVNENIVQSFVFYLLFLNEAAVVFLAPSKSKRKSNFDYFQQNMLSVF
jgi:hypothetical protein